MTFGTDVRTFVRSLVDGANNVKSTMTLTNISSSNNNLGYEGRTETEDSTATVNCIPSRAITEQITREKFGELQEGDIRLLVRDDQTIDTNDKVTFDSVDYNVRSIRKIPLNEVVIAKVLILRKRQ